MAISAAITYTNSTTIGLLRKNWMNSFLMSAVRGRMAQLIRLWKRAAASPNSTSV